jgi:hypothetical protein
VFNVLKDFGLSLFKALFRKNGREDCRVGAARRVTNFVLLGFTAQPLTPLNRPGKENQKFKFFSKCSENSKNFKEYYSKVTDHEYLVSSAILYRYCGEIAGWAVGRLSGVSG